uniref:Uncharacterized protein n=1 Tax=Oryza punctata TaxID=4537 RepID=A0A0E0JX56_ORYPU
MATSIGFSTHGGRGQLGRSEAIGKDDAWLLGLFLLGAKQLNKVGGRPTADEMMHDGSMSSQDGIPHTRNL